MRNLTSKSGARVATSSDDAMRLARITPTRFRLFSATRVVTAPRKANRVPKEAPKNAETFSNVRDGSCEGLELAAALALAGVRSGTERARGCCTSVLAIVAIACCS
jgi:hypothetical protein